MPQSEQTALKQRPVSGEISELRQNIVRAAKKELGRPYAYGGKDKRGFDCSGLTHFVFQQFDISLPPVSSEQAKLGSKISINELKPGDLMFFKRTKAGKVFHVALVSETNHREVKVIHSTSRGVVEDEITNSGFWGPKIFSCKRIIP